MNSQHSHHAGLLSFVYLPFLQFEEQALSAKFHRLSWKRATSYTWTRLPDPIVRRQLHMVAIEGRAALPEEKFNEVSPVYTEKIQCTTLYFLYIPWVIIKRCTRNCLHFAK